MDPLRAPPDEDAESPVPLAVVAGAVAHRAHPCTDRKRGGESAAIPALGQAVSDPTTLRQYDALAVKLAESGFSPRSIVLSVSALDVLCLGAALDASAPSAPGSAMAGARRRAPHETGPGAPRWRSADAMSFPGGR